MWIVHAEVKDDERYADYIKGSSQVVASFEGEFLARGGRYLQKEGKEYPRHVLIRFPTYENAVKAYESDEYQALVELAKETSDRTLVILEIDD
jgi:uncharacterized protein (DUF1330 family)